MPSNKPKKRAHSRKPVPSKTDILDVHGVAALLSVSTDTIYDLFQSGQLPGHKIGRSWRTTRGAVMRWMEHAMAAATRERAISGGDKTALTKLLQSNAVRVKSG